MREVLVHDEYQLQFMHPVSYMDASIGHYDSGECYVNWPEYDDLLEIGVADILCMVSKPTKTTHEGVDCFTLPKKEIAAVEYRYQNFTF